jgi:hypothetical protein
LWQPRQHIQKYKNKEIRNYGPDYPIHSWEKGKEGEGIGINEMKSHKFEMTIVEKRERERDRFDLVKPDTGVSIC